MPIQIRHEQYLNHIITLSQDEYRVLCKLIDESNAPNGDWTINELQEAVNSSKTEFNQDMLIKDVLLGMGWNEYKITHAKPYSSHPNDHYLFVVLGESLEGPEKYVTWLYNAESHGMSEGHYCLDKHYVVKDYNHRGMVTHITEEDLRNA